MDIKEILGVIFAGISLLILCGSCLFIVIYLAKEEKERKLLCNKELKARIKFYDDLMEYLNTNYK